MEICLDCKDKALKFYHFKRKVKEVQKQNISKIVNRTKSQAKHKQNKIIHNIVKIVQDYTKKHSISSIRIEESAKKLVIESQDNSKAPCLRTSQADTSDLSLSTGIEHVDLLDIKVEPDHANDDEPRITNGSHACTSHEMKNDYSEFEPSKPVTPVNEHSPPCSSHALSRSQRKEGEFIEVHGLSHYCTV